MFTESAVAEGFWCPTEETGRIDHEPSISGSEWVALLKVASRDWSIDLAELACLLERRLIEKRDGVLGLTEQGRIALGMPV